MGILEKKLLWISMKLSVIFVFVFAFALSEAEFSREDVAEMCDFECAELTGDDQTQCLDDCMSAPDARFEEFDEDVLLDRKRCRCKKGTTNQKMRCRNRCRNGR